MPFRRRAARYRARKSRCRRLSGPLACLFALLAGDALATGWPPFANDDFASVKRGASVAVLDSGAASVLANDFDLEGDTLTAELTREPRDGQLEFAADGTFRYTHNGLRDRDDEFRYRAFDGTRYSRETKVKIEILPGDPIPPEIVGQRDVAVDEDGFVDISLQDLVVVDPDSKYPADFSLDVGDGDNYTRSGVRIFPSPDFNGTLLVPVRVSDGVAYSNWFDLIVDVIPVNDPPYVVAPVPDQEAAEGLDFELALAGHFADVDADDQLRFTAFGLPGSGTLTIDEQSGLMSGIPARADVREEPYVVTVRASDTGGANVSLDFRLTIFPEDRSDLRISARISKNPVLVGEAAGWQIDIENRGPAALEAGEVVGSWMTAGASISLIAPAPCSIESNGTARPTLRCALPQMPVGSTTSIAVEGQQSEAGDNTILARAVADDPRPEDNATVLSAQVAGAFSAGPAQVLARTAPDIAVGDLDGDGRPDLVLAGNDLSVHLNTGERRLDATGRVVGAGGSRVSLLDWNGDGITDIAVGGPQAGNAGVYVGAAGGSFEALRMINLGTTANVTALVAADLDLDGRDELLFAGEFGVRIVRNQAGDANAAESVLATPVVDIAIADLNSDAAPDLAAVVGGGSRDLAIFENSGAGMLVDAGTVTLGPGTSVTAADVDRDGAMDLIVGIGAQDTAAPHTRIVLGDGTGTLRAADALGASTPSDLCAGDVNADGVVDIVVVNATGVHQIYLGGSGGYVLDSEQLVSYPSRRGVVADINEDGSLDLLLTGEAAAGVELHANNGLGLLGPGDIVPPQLLLEGDAVMEIPAGAEFVDPGATATDDVDGDLTEAIVVIGAINTTVVGTQSITYTVSDRASNTSSATRTVKVGVNAGTGGSGGGAASAASLLALLLLCLASASVRIFRVRTAARRLR